MNQNVNFNVSDDVENIIEQIDNIVKLELEEFNKDEQFDKTQCDVINLKNLDTDQLTAVFRYCLTNENIVNPSILLNMFNLVKRFNTLDQSFFESEQVWFSNLEQFLDVKLNLTDEIKSFSSKLAFWYLSCICSMHKVEYTVMEHVEVMPLTYRYFIMTSDMMTLSAVVATADPIDTKQLVLVDKAYIFVSELASRLSLASAFLELM